MNLTPQQIDALREMINIGVGHAAGVLNAMLQSHIVLQLPVIQVLSGSEFQERLKTLPGGVFSSVRLGFRGAFSGSASLVLPAENAAKLFVLLMGDETLSPERDAIKIGTLTEVGNVVLNGVMGAIGNEVQQRIYYSVPLYMENLLPLILASTGSDPESPVVWIQTRFNIKSQQIDGEIVMLLEVGSLDLLLTAINHELGIEHNN